MGKIQVGQKSPKTIDMGGFTVVSSTSEVKNDAQAAGNAAGKVLSAEEKAKLDKENRLAEIQALPVEEQLPLLLEEGFTDEAQELSERLAAEKAAAENAGEGEGTENPTDGEGADVKTSLDSEGTVAAPDGCESGEAAAEPEKKNGGRPKKAATE